MLDTALLAEHCGSETYHKAILIIRRRFGAPKQLAVQDCDVRLVDEPKTVLGDVTNFARKFVSGHKIELIRAS